MTRALLALAAAAGSASVAAADPPAPSTVADLAGARSVGLSAFRGLASGNDAIFGNPATLASRRRYAIEVQYLQERAGGGRAWQWLQTSVVDSETSSVAAGLSYTRIFDGNRPDGAYTGSAYHLPLATRVGGSLFAGLTGKYLDLRTPAGKVQVGTVDAGLFWQASSLVGFGLAGYNLVPVGKKDDAPRAMGAGIAVGDDRRFHVAVDWRGDFQRRDKLTSAWSAGAEYLVGDVVAARGGFLKDDTRRGSFWSAGLGLVTTSGVALDASYRQSVQDPSDRTFVVGLKLFMQAPAQ